MPPKVFTLAEARELQSHRLFATKDFKDEFDRVLIPETYLARVIGIDAWREDDGEDLACIAVEFTGHEKDGWPPKVILMNKTTFHEHFEDVSVHTP